jgi:hypothetical protein
MTFEAYITNIRATTGKRRTAVMRRMASGRLGRRSTA